ncbi:DNA mismatch repair endonuclease MutL [Clostridium vincentii]|uniref:DNA mismatch repair protein MutL n=1 Tax=Clostridium vincentii TaxID=52704 RepID=A0A2T0BBR8_9CLOT|nr:DNA mismatch repair endonuclease MutL [Clostridium vincentii]PRR81340.1 DNA mismatch repair protein MutL [Clostridium vincentii]
MNRINLLDEDTSNKIAAGEVIERPSSVVKELIENSIDANAKNITVEIEEGGTSLIRIIDDGDGIYPEDLKKAFLPHATSKIKDSEDIFSIKTLGFRGEALPSIAAVSLVNVKSRIGEEDFGRELIIEGGVIKEFKECGSNKGTSLEVRDIFFNVPARKKFLKTLSRESTLITDVVNKAALANPNISFKLYNSGKKIVHTYGTDDLKDVLRTVYGKNISDNLVYFEKIDDIITLYGYIGTEEIARGSRNNQSIFVNGRYIKHKSIAVAVEHAFKSFSTVNKFPFFIIFIDIYPDLIDVNIHPTKAEIKFTDDRIIFKQVFEAVHSALKEKVFSNFRLPEEKINEDISFKIEELKLDIKQLGDEKVALLSLEKKDRLEVTLPLDLKNEVVRDPTNELIKETSIPFNVESKDEALTIGKTAKFPPIKLIGQFNKTYILGEYDEVLYMIDQHAAHEKILFEKYLKNIENASLIVQPLLIPTIIDLTIDDYANYEENYDVFKTAGFMLEAFGGNTLSLKEVPYFLGKLDPKGLFINILDDLKNLGTGKTVDVKYNRIATMACKAAVKGNDSLSEIEMLKLVEELRYIDDPFHCPHGRPTIIKFSNYDLEKKFKRIV